MFITVYEYKKCFNFKQGKVCIEGKDGIRYKTC